MVTVWSQGNSNIPGYLPPLGQPSSDHFHICFHKPRIISAYNIILPATVFSKEMIFSDYQELKEITRLLWKQELDFYWLQENVFDLEKIFQFSQLQEKKIWFKFNTLNKNPQISNIFNFVKNIFSFSSQLYFLLRGWMRKLKIIWTRRDTRIRLNSIWSKSSVLFLFYFKFSLHFAITLVLYDIMIVIFCEVLLNIIIVYLTT